MDLERFVVNCHASLRRNQGYISLRDRTYLLNAILPNEGHEAHIRYDPTLHFGRLKHAGVLGKLRKEAGLPPIWTTEYESPNRWTDPKGVTHQLFPTQDAIIGTLYKAIHAKNQTRSVGVASVNETREVAALCRDAENPEELTEWLIERIAKTYRNDFTNPNTAGIVADRVREVWDKMRPQLNSYASEKQLPPAQLSNASPLWGVVQAIEEERKVYADLYVQRKEEFIQSSRSHSYKAFTKKRPSEREKIELALEIDYADPAIEREHRNERVAYHLENLTPHNIDQGDLSLFDEEEVMKTYAQTILSKRVSGKHAEDIAKNLISATTKDIAHTCRIDIYKAPNMGQIILQEAGKALINAAGELTNHELFVALANPNYLPQHQPEVRTYLTERFGKHLENVLPNKGTKYKAERVKAWGGIIPAQK